MQFTQSGQVLSGPIEIEGSTCITAGTVTGTFSGDTISFGAVHAGATILYTGKLSGDSMSGTYQAPSCSNDKGTWEASRSG